MRKFQVITIALLILSLGFITPTLSVYAASTITVTIDGVKQTYNPQPQILNGRVMLPLRAVCESLGIEVTYNQETHVARMQKGDTLIIHQIGTDKISINGKQQSFDTASTVIDSRTLVPIRMLAEAIGADVQWIAATNTAAITTGGLSQAQPTTATRTVINLDGKTSVVLEDVIAHIGAQEVTNNAAVSFTGHNDIVPLKSLADNYEPFDPAVVGADILYTSAKGFVEARYTVDYQTTTIDDYWGAIFPHFNNSYRAGNGETGIQSTQSYLDSINSQKIKMTAIFVSDPSLVYTVNAEVAKLNTAGISHATDLSPWAVRGTMYYKLDSFQQGDSGFWYGNDEELGKWYAADLEVRFGINEKVDRNKAVTHYAKWFWIDTAPRAVQ